MADAVREKLPPPEVTVIANAVDGTPPPVVVARADLMLELWEGVIHNLTTRTSRAFLLHGGCGKTTCVGALLRELRPISTELEDHCIIDIVELDNPMIFSPV
ncbi:hypothetical protein ACLB2K_040061 [Fragaria x ananassa]